MIFRSAHLRIGKLPEHLAAHLSPGIICPTGWIVLRDGEAEEVTCKREALNKARQLFEEKKMDRDEWEILRDQINQSDLVDDLGDEVVEMVHNLSRDIGRLLTEAYYFAEQKKKQEMAQRN